MQNTSNTSNRPSEKVIGSNMIDFGTKTAYTSFDQLIMTAELIVIGEVISDAETVEYEIMSGTPLDQKIKQKAGRVPTFKTANATIKIEEILFGEYLNKELTYVQLGEANNDKYQTKVKKGDRALFLLTADKTIQGHFSSIAFEEGVFIIDRRANVVSQSNNPIVSKFDHSTLSKLKEEIMKIALQN